MNTRITTSEDEALRQGLRRRPNPLERERLVGLAEEVSRFYTRIAKRSEDLPKPYRPGGEWERYVDARRWFYEAMVAEDYERVADALADFWRNDLGPIVSQYAYFRELDAGDEAKISRFSSMLSRDHQHWKALWKDGTVSLSIPEVGNPWGVELDGVLVTPLAMRFDTHTRQIAELLRASDAPIVTEIGGGYGGMGHRLATRAPQLTYVDFDIPETLAIAAFYLRATLPDRRVLLWDEERPLTRETIVAHDIVLAPHYALADLGEATIDLFLNAFSLSEMRRETVVEYFAQIERCSKRYFLQNNVDRHGVINRGFERIPCSEFPISSAAFKTLYFRFDTFQGPDGDYRESLHERLP